MSGDPQYRPVKEPLARRIALSGLADYWAKLGAPPIVDIPDAGILASIARASLPILIGRTLIRAEKTSGKWHVSKDDLRVAALDLIAFTVSTVSTVSAVSAEPSSPSNAPDHPHVTIRVTDEHWQGKLARMLRDTSREPIAWTGPYWKKHWYWQVQWGCVDFAAVSTGADDTWTIPHHYAEFAAAAAEQVEQFSAERRRCSRCGETTVRRRGWADVDTSVGWENLCADCLASHDSRLREYQGQLRDIPYARARYRRENPPTWYRCVLCGLPAVVWDHCHEHGYIRGPLCRGCNTNDNWLFRSPYRLDRLPIDHVEQCKGCAGAGPGIGVVAAVIQFWIAGRATTPEGHAHPEGVRYAAFPTRLAIQGAVKEHTYAVEAIAWACRDCDERWEQPLDPDQMLDVGSRVLHYLRSGDLSVIAGDAQALVTHQVTAPAG